MITRYNPPEPQSQRSFRSLIVTILVFGTIAVLLIAPLSTPGFDPSGRLSSGQIVSSPTMMVPEILVTRPAQAPTLIVSSAALLVNPLSANPVTDAQAVVSAPTPTLVALTVTPDASLLASTAVSSVPVPTATVKIPLTIPLSMPLTITMSSIFTAPIFTAPRLLITTPLSITSSVTTTSPATESISTPVMTDPVSALLQPSLTPAPTLPPAAPPVLTPTLTPTATSRAIVALVELVGPASETVSGEHKITFAWQVAEQPLTPEQCTELVFWDPENSADQRSPVGAGKEEQKRVAFDLLATGSDPLLRTLAQSRRAFHWGVRIVSCADPQVVLRDVEEVRAYTYQP